MLALTFARLGIETGLSSLICGLASLKVTYSAGLFFLWFEPCFILQGNNCISSKSVWRGKDLPPLSPNNLPAAL